MNTSIVLVETPELLYSHSVSFHRCIRTCCYNATPIVRAQGRKKVVVPARLLGLDQTRAKQASQTFRNKLLILKISSTPGNGRSWRFVFRVTLKLGLINF